MTKIALDITKSHFSSLVVKVQSAMEENKVDVSNIRQFLQDFFQQHIPEVDDLCKVFDYVTRSKLWGYDNYHPLKELTEMFLPIDNQARVLMTECPCRLAAYDCTIKILDQYSQYDHEHTDSEEDDQLFSPKKYNRQYRQLTVKLKQKRKISELTLVFLDVIWKRLQREYDLPSLTTVLDQILYNANADRDKQSFTM